MSFRLEELLSRRLLIVSGKGGVGKTTIALALGLIAAQRGKKTIVAEVNSEEQLAHLLERPPLGYEETELLPGLWGINILPKKSFEEYVLLQIRLKTLYRAVFENRFVRHFIEATPGLSDLMCIGKVYSLTNRHDLVIVDAPATGHGVALLAIPSIVSRAIRVGPLKTEAEKVDLLLHDPQRTAVVLVTLPEEMPVMEAVELRTRLEEMGLSLGPFFLNQVQESGFGRREKAELARHPALWERIEILIARSEMSEEYAGRLADAAGNRPIVPIPFVFSPGFGLAEVQTIAAEIEKNDSG